MTISYWYKSLWCYFFHQKGLIDATTSIFYGKETTWRRTFYANKPTMFGETPGYLIDRMYLYCLTGCPKCKNRWIKSCRII